MSSGSWCTVESDPGVFTELISQIGVTGVQVEELYDLEQEHLDRIKPVFGLIFLFKYQASPLDPATQTLITPDNPLNDEIYFARQMITNACGTQAILNLILNLDPARCQQYGIQLGDELKNFKEFTHFLPADMRGEAISNSELIRRAHNGFARPEPFVFEEKKPRDDEESEDCFHFIGYIPINGRLYELDGLKPGPIQLHQQGQAEVTDENWMAAARTAIQSRLQQYVSKEIRFNLMALIGNQTDQWKRKVDELEKEVEKAGGGAAQKAPPAATATPTPASADAMDTSESSASASVAGGSSVVASSPSSVSDPGRLMQLQDALADARKQLTEEALKMERWRVENLRRKHNYVPFIFNLLRLLAEKGKLSGLVELAVKNAAERNARARQAAAKRKEPSKTEQTKTEGNAATPAAATTNNTATPTEPPAKK